MGWRAVLIAMCLPGAAMAAADGCYPLELAAGSRLLVAAAVNGHAVTALLDSAAEMTLLDSRFAAALRLAPAGEATGRGSGAGDYAVGMVPGVTLEVFGIRLPGQSVAVTDLGDVGARLLQRQVDVILGREIFDVARLQIDIDGRSVCVVHDATPRGVRLDLGTEHGIETLPASIEGHEAVHAALDFGNGSQVLVSRAYADHLGLTTDGRPVRTERGGGLGGEAERQVFVLRSLELAGERFTGVAAAIDANASATDLNLGTSVLRHFIVTTDFGHHAVWLLPLKRDDAGGR